MSTSSSILLEHNPFDRLGIDPTSSAADFRAAIEAARMEAELGLRHVGNGRFPGQIGEPETLTVAAVDEGAQLLRDSAACFEARLLATWDADPRLALWAPAHDHAIERLRAATKLRTDPIDGVEPWLQFWLPGLVDPLAALAPPTFDVRDFAARTAIEASRRALVNVPLAQSSALVGRAADIEPLAAGMMTESLIDRVERDLLSIDADLDGLPEGANEDALLTRFRQVLDAATEIRSLAMRLCRGCGALRASDVRFCSVCGGLMAAAAGEWPVRIEDLARSTGDHLGARLFRRERYDESVAVLAFALGFVVDEDGKDRLASSVAIVRLQRARAMAHEALDAGNREQALAMLEDVRTLTDDPEEARTAGELIAAIRSGRLLAKDAKKIKRAPTLFQWWGFGLGLAGGHDRDGTGAYSSVYYLTLLWIPFLPLRRYRVSSHGEGRYQFFGRLPLRPRDYVHMAVAIVVAAGVGVWIAVSGSDETASPSSSSSASSRSGSTIARGDCIRVSGTDSSISTREVSCSSSHDGYVVQVIPLPGNSYPGASSISRRANSDCAATTTSFVYPSRDSWSDGDREILCIDETR